MIRSSLTSLILASSLAMATSVPAFAAERDASAAVATTLTPDMLKPGQFAWYDDAAAGGPHLVDGRSPVSVVVSIPDQKAYVYRNGTLIAASAVSTGKEGHDTPTGEFTILQKEKMHHSNLYNDAPMPYMQRLTWDGIALHSGRNPGYPASHGCIRLPDAFAKKLFQATAVGATVSVVDTPVLDPAGAQQAPDADQVAPTVVASNDAALQGEPYNVVTAETPATYVHASEVRAR